jgi:hypothetical protein
MGRKVYEALRFMLPMFAICTMLAASVPAFAQEVTGSLQGRVEDPSGAVIKGATVELSGGQRTLTTTTDDEGGFQFLNVPPGLYTVTVSASGFANARRTDVPVELGRNLQVNFEMKAGLTGETIDVSASDEPIVDVTSTKTATNVTQQEFNLIPKTLNFASVINVAPGARQENLSGGYQIDGASGVENVYIVDGVEVTRVEDGQLGQTKNIPFDFVQEVQIKSAGYEAEFGGATGGVINVVTRSGSNDWHGEVRGEFQFDELVAEDNPILRLDPLAPQERSEYFQNPVGKDDYRLFNPVLSLGGPIVKDHLWFYASYAPQFEKRTRPYFLTRNTGEAIEYLERNDIEFKTKYDYTFSRLDWQPWDRLSANVSFIRSPVYNEGLYPTTRLGFQQSTNPTQYAIDVRNAPLKGGYSQAWQLGSSVTYNATDSLVLNFRTGTNYLNDKATNYGLDPSITHARVLAPCDPNTFPGDCPAGSTVTSNTTTPNNFQTIFNVTKRHKFDVDATWVGRFFNQQHIIKGGYQLNRLSNEVLENYPAGRLLLYYDTEFGGERGEFGYYRFDLFGTQGDVSSRNQALFIQDAWTVHPRLTLNLGLRIENEYLPAFPIDPTFHPTIDPADISSAPPKPIEFGWGDKVGPRVGAAWDVFGDSRLKVYGSFGLFYDQMKYELPRGSFGGDIYLIRYFTLDTADFTQIGINNLPGTPLGSIDARVPSSLTPKPGEQPGIDPDLMATREREYTVGADYAFSTNLLFGVRFTRKQLDRTIEDVGRHDQDGNEIYTIGNPGFGATQDTTFFSFPAPKAVRNYTGVEFRLDKRFVNNWYANITYLYSRLYGNYSGLAATDEITDVSTGAGRSSPNVNRYWDFPTLLFDANGNETLGRLATDRPHTLKVYAGYRFDWLGMSTDVAGTQLAYSGLPVTTRVEFLSAEHIANGRGDLGRTEAFTQTDLLLTHRWPINERFTIKASFNVLNVFDERGEQVRWELLTGPGVQFDTVCQTGDPCFPLGAYQEYFGSGSAFTSYPQEQLDPRFNRAMAFQLPREARFSVGFEF